MSEKVKKVKQFLADKGISQAELARSIGVSSTAISRYLANMYAGDSVSLETKLIDFMDNYLVKTEKISEIIETENLRACYLVLDEAVINNELAVIYGKSGYGKTTAVLEYVKKHPEAIYINAIAGMRHLDFLRKLATEIGVEASNNSTSMIEAIANEFSRRRALIIIDEAEIFNSRTLDSIRKIHDLSKVPTVLVGTHSLLTNLRGRHGQLEYVINRVQSRYEFIDLTEAEFQKFFGEHSKHIAKFTRHLRRAVNIFSKANRFASIKNERLTAVHIEQASRMVFLG